LCRPIVVFAQIKSCSVACEQQVFAAGKSSALPNSYILQCTKILRFNRK